MVCGDQDWATKGRSDAVGDALALGRQSIREKDPFGGSAAHDHTCAYSINTAFPRNGYLRNVRNRCPG